MNILITGGAGFIGSHLQDRLLELGHEIAVIDSLRTGKKENLDPKTKFYQVDIREGEEIKKIFQEFQPEIVFHLAAQNSVPYSMDHPLEDAETNVLGMMNLLEASKEVKFKKFIFSNTGGALYGDVEDVDLPLAEDFITLRPSSFYGVSKRCAEEYLKLYGNLYGIGWVSLRYANVYGPRQDGSQEIGVTAIFIHKLIHKEAPTINGDGSHTRDYVYVSDVVDANIKALDFTGNDYFNISTEVETSNKQVYETVAGILNFKEKPNYGSARPGDPLRSCLSNKKAKEILGWTPKVTFKEGVQKTIDYYKK